MTRYLGLLLISHALCSWSARASELDAEARRPADLVRDTLAAWAPLDDFDSLTNTVRAFAKRDIETTGSAELDRLVAYARSGGSGFGGFEISNVLRRMLDRQELNEEQSMKAIMIDASITHWTIAMSGSRNVSELFLEKLLDSEWPSVRRRAAMSLQRYVRSSVFDGYKEQRRLFGQAYWHETDESVRVELRKLVESIDPAAIRLGPSGTRRRFWNRLCEIVLGR